MAYSDIYVDPSIGAESGSGTFGSPYGDLEYAIKQTTFDTTNGTRVNIKAGATETLAANLNTALADTSVTAAWAPSNTAPCIFQGYTSLQGDGGLGDISGGGTVPIFDNVAQSNMYFIDLKLHNTGSNRILYMASNCMVQNCELYDTTSQPLQFSSSASSVLNCYVHDATGQYGISTSIDCIAAFNRIVVAPTFAALLMNGGSVAYRNIISVSAATGITLNGTDIEVSHNSIYASSTAANKHGIDSANYSQSVMNNIVSGFSGTSNVGINLTSTSFERIVQGNVVYNCTTAYSYGGPVVFSFDNKTAGADPFTDAANGDFRPIDTASIKEGAEPQFVGLR